MTTLKPMSQSLSFSMSSKDSLEKIDVDLANDLYNVYVINATDSPVMGIVLNGVNQFFGGQINRTCSKTPPTNCHNDPSARHLILTQGCNTPGFDLALIFKGADGNLYKTKSDPVRPNCAYAGLEILFYG